jgi:hypothetical protein
MEKLDSTSPEGWYEVLSKEQPVVTAVLWWDGKYLRGTKEPVTGRGDVPLNWCTNFRPLVVAADESPDEVTHYLVEVIDPASSQILYENRLQAGTTAEQARDAFDRTCDDVEDRVRLIEIRKRPIAAATAKV